MAKAPKNHKPEKEKAVQITLESNNLQKGLQSQNEDSFAASPVGRILLLKEKMKIIEEKAKAEADSGRLYRIYASAGNPLDAATYRFVAEFSRRKSAEKYAKYIHNKKRFSDKSVLIKQVIGEEPAAEEGEIIYAMSPLGEFLTQGKDSDTDSYTPQSPNGQKKNKPGKGKSKKPTDKSNEKMPNENKGNTEP